MRFNEALRCIIFTTKDESILTEARGRGVQGTSTKATSETVVMPATVFNQQEVVVHNGQQATGAVTCRTVLAITVLISERKLVLESRIDRLHTLWARKKDIFCNEAYVNEGSTEAQCTQILFLNLTLAFDCSKQGTRGNYVPQELSKVAQPAIKDLPLPAGAVAVVVVVSEVWVAATDGDFSLSALSSTAATYIIADEYYHSKM